MNFISGFDTRLSLNFNHLLLIDDLIIVIEASKSIAKACLLALKVYREIIGQCSNLAKFAIYFPSWFNKKVFKSISEILSMNVGKFFLQVLRSSQFS